jgi:hypothetical protein
MGFPAHAIRNHGLESPCHSALPHTFGGIGSGASRDGMGA